MTTCLNGYTNFLVEATLLGGHWSSASADIKYLIFHVTPQNHVIKGSCNFMSWSSSLHATTLPSLVVIVLVAVEI